MARTKHLLYCNLLTLVCIAACAQNTNPYKPSPLTGESLDPSRKATPVQLESARHKPLPEQYIWTEEDSGVGHYNPGDWMFTPTAELGPHYFRRSFQLSAVPSRATLYVAGPRSLSVYVNGALVKKDASNPDSPLGQKVYSVDVTRNLHAGTNLIAIEAIRGKGVGAVPDDIMTIDVTRGKVLLVKLLPADPGVLADAMVMSDVDWRGSLTASDGWNKPGFNDSSWKPVSSLGAVESSINLFQWNADAGLYDWPGYDGISAFLAHFQLDPLAVTDIFTGAGEVHNPEALQGSSSSEFSVDLPNGPYPQQDAPHVLLDFGRDANGRLEFTSDSDAPSQVTLQYGESEEETLKQPFLGVNVVEIPAHGTAYGPKSTFRYAYIQFISGGREARFKSIRLDGIYYPVEYKGSFESSDPVLNQMWNIGAYTAHLCMQDDIWDAPKRDRGRWMGDLDVSGRTIEDAFDDHFLMEDTLERLMGPAPIKRHVNGIAGYSAFWLTGEAEYYRHVGDVKQLEGLHQRIVQLMEYMEGDLDANGLYANNYKAWPFVDWSPELNGDTPLSRAGTTYEFYDAFKQGVYLLHELHDEQNAARFQQQADKIKASAQQHLLDPSTGSFGTRWQTNAYAVLSGVADPSQYEAIWKNALSSVGKVRYNGLIITPYYNYYVISAMAKMGHREQALDWIRQYWGGMIDEGATSFWEGYDPDWYKADFHASLQADNMSGYRVSLAHGWSTGVTPWLMEELIGIHSRGVGFSQVDIRPDLLGLEYARGAEPTPRGLLKVDLKKQGSGMSIGIDLPPSTIARVSVPVGSSGATVQVNGKATPGTSDENGARSIITLDHGGHYDISTQ